MLRILNNNQLYVTSVSVVEVLIRFRRDMLVLRELLSFIYKKNIHVINTGIYGFDRAIILALYKINDKDLNEIISDVLVCKIDAEAAAASSMLLLEASLFLDYLFDKKSITDDNTKIMLLNLFFEQEIFKIDNLTKEFKKVLISSYQEEYITGNKDIAQKKS